MDIDPQYRTDEGTALRIWRDTAKNNFLTEKLGRPIFDDVILIEVITPGATGSTPVFEVRRDFNAEMKHPEPVFGMQYERFKHFVQQFETAETADASMTGTPLKEWPELPASMIATLRASGVFTVDALAALPDTKLTICGPDGRTWREKASAYIAYAKDTATATQTAAELARVRDELAERDKHISELAAKVQALEAVGTAKQATEDTTAAAAEAAAAEAAKATATKTTATKTTALKSAGDII